MAFYGCEFNFDGIPCSEYGLMIYDLGTNSQDDVSFGSAGEVQEDTIARRYSSFFYGITQNEGLTYNLVFGANLKSIDRNNHIDRYEIDAIATWLTGHNTRKWLEIVQPDMETVRFHCIISELTLITEGRYPWAFTCKVQCDSPFAYTFPEEYTTSLPAGSLYIYNRSSYRGYYRPKIELRFPALSGAENKGVLRITNKSDNNKTYEIDFSKIPGGIHQMFIDCENQVVSGDGNANLYPAFSPGSFLGLKRGDNHLNFSTDGHNTQCNIKVICEYPINVGG